MERAPRPHKSKFALALAASLAIAAPHGARADEPTAANTFTLSLGRGAEIDALSSAWSFASELALGPSALRLAIEVRLLDIACIGAGDPALDLGFAAHFERGPLVINASLSPLSTHLRASLGLAF